MHTSNGSVVNIILFCIIVKSSPQPINVAIAYSLNTDAVLLKLLLI